jgi:hypothetical protein
MKKGAKKKQYLPLADVTNMYAQFGKLSPRDKAIVNKRFEIKCQFRKLQRLLSLR